VKSSNYITSALESSVDVGVTSPAIPRGCLAHPSARFSQNRPYELVLSAHVPDDVVAVMACKVLLESSIGKCTVRMSAQIVAKCQLVGHFRVTNSANVDLVGADAVSILAEVKATSSSRDLSVQALTSDSIAKLFHCAAEPADCIGLIQDSEKVYDRFRDKAWNRRTANVMSSHKRIPKNT
jgi:hypothetical protein